MATMYHHIETINKRYILLKQSNRYSGVKKYNHWNLKFTRGTQLHIQTIKKR